MADAKEMWEAIKSRFGGNDKSKKMQKYLLKQQFEGFSVSASEGLHKGYDRFQTLLSHLEIHGAGVSYEDVNQKFLRSLPSSWSQVALIIRTKPRLDTLSFDDLYNNLRVFKHDVKGTTASSSSNTQNVAFVSADNTSSTNDINDDDLEEMDLKWQGILLETVEVNGIKTVEEEMVGTMETKLEIIAEDLHLRMIQKLWLPLMERLLTESYARLKKLYDEQKDKLGDASVEITAYTLALKKVEAQLLCHQQNQLAYEQKIKFMKIDLDDKIDVLTYHKKLLAEALKEKEDLKTKVENWQNSSKNLNRLLNTQMSANDKFRLGYGDYRYGSILSYKNEVLQKPSTSMPEPVVNESKVVSDPKAVCKSKVWTDAPIIEEYKSDSDDDLVFNVQENIEKSSFALTDSVKHVKSPRETVKETGTPNHYPKIEK
nr:ribonuclease H-like domain-containing protein [Tanacetum cinerariifolium]